MTSLFGQLKLQAAFTPKKAAIVLIDRVYTYEMMVNGVLSVQAVLADLALDRGKVVGVLIDNPGRHLIVLLALLQSGLAFTSLRSETLDVARNFGVDTVITDKKLPLFAGERVVWADDKWFARTDVPKNGAFDVRHADDGIVNLRFSSGSTGVPKVLALSWKTLNLRWMKTYLFGLAAGGRYLSTIGLSGSALAYVSRVLASGNTVVFAPLEQAFNAVFSFGVSEVRCSAVQAATILDQQRATGYDYKLDLISIGGAALANGMAEELERVFNCDVWDTYAATEPGVVALAGPRVMKMRRQKGNCFAPVCPVEIVDDEGRLLSVGKEGRIRVKSDTMVWPFSGSMFETEDGKGDGWFYPGDIGRLDDDGLLIVTGRADEVINAGGIKFTPEILENALKKHPALRDAAVIRMTGSKGVSEPWLAVVSNQSITLDQINLWIAANVPGEVGSVAVSKLVKLDEIPVTGTGKVARQVLRSQLQASS
jgi:acyl-coenzyme A synthetase/AMP-(fatty) acid ligase